VLVHVSILVFVPFSVGLLTYLSNRLSFLSFFIFPPLAAGTYALFANPESEYASPVRFVTGLTAGAACASVAVWVAVRFVYPELPPTALEVDAPGAAFAVLLTGLVTWTVDVEEAAAFSMALLGLLIPPARQPAFVGSVLVTSAIVAAVFTAWREFVYERRAQYFYESTRGDDHVLVPMRDVIDGSTAMLGGRLAAAHDAGKVVLLDVVAGERAAAVERRLLRTDLESEPAAAVAGQGAADATDTAEGSDGATAAADPAAAMAVSELKSLADRIETELDVPCEVVVAAGGGSPVEAVRRVRVETNCDLTVVPYEGEDGELSAYVTRLLETAGDVVVHRSYGDRTRWSHITVPVRKAGDTAHNMLDFALRIVEPDGRVSVAHCIGDETERRVADRMLADLVETFDGTIETRVQNTDIRTFLRRAARANDLLVIGASQERGLVSRIVSPPTFEGIHDVETDVAIVARE
jgi:hypothetical protein